MIYKSFAIALCVISANAKNSLPSLGVTDDSNASGRVADNPVDLYTLPKIAYQKSTGAEESEESEETVNVTNEEQSTRRFRRVNDDKGVSAPDNEKAHQAPCQAPCKALFKQWLRTMDLESTNALVNCVLNKNDEKGIQYDSDVNEELKRKNEIVVKPVEKKEKPTVVRRLRRVIDDEELNESEDDVDDEETLYTLLAEWLRENDLESFNALKTFLESNGHLID